MAKAQPVATFTVRCLRCGNQHGVDVYLEKVETIFFTDGSSQMSVQTSAAPKVHSCPTIPQDTRDPPRPYGG